MAGSDRDQQGPEAPDVPRVAGATVSPRPGSDPRGVEGDAPGDAPGDATAARSGAANGPRRPRRARTRGSAPEVRPVDPQAFGAARAALLAAVAGGPPEPIRSLLVDELAGLTLASRALLDSFSPSILTVKGAVRPRYKSYLKIQERVERLVALLKLDASGGKRHSIDPAAHLESIRRRHAESGS
jgi:hypothetical protein